MVRCFIGSNYERYSLNLTNILKKFVCEENIVTVPDFNDFISNYEAQDERVILFADRYYFGFHVENQLFKIFSVNPKTEIVIFDEMEFEKQFAFRLYNTGIRGLLDHVITGNDTEKRMQKVLGGQRVFPDNIAAFIANGEHLDKKDCYNAPTVKEFQFLCLVSYGFGYKQICGRFDISETMLGTYIERIRNRLGAKTTTEAVRIMLQTKENSHLEDDEYDSFCGWDLQQGVLVEYERAGEAAKRKSPKRRTGAQCRHLQERADGMYSKKRKGQALHNDEHRRPDRDNEKIDQSGWVLDGYKKNPVILWSHDRNIPAIGYMENIILGKTLQGEMIFNDREFDPFGWGIGQRLLKGSLNCGSVGFRVIEAEVVNHSVNPDEKADLIFRKQELLEFSVCNVPANPYAEVIRTARSGEEKSLYEFLKKGGYRLN